MTVGIAINCTDGIVVACDSLATYSRGAPVARYTNKIHVLQHDNLEQPIALIGAGMMAFVGKFLDRSRRDAIEQAHKQLKRKLDVIDFSEVSEAIVATLFKEYMLDRAAFFNAPLGDFSLSMIVAGATRDGELRTYHIHAPGLAERIEEYGTTGSGAAYAELFLRSLLEEPATTTIADAQSVALYAIKGVGMMDPNVGGPTGIKTLTFANKKLTISAKAESTIDSKAMKKMETAVGSIGNSLRKLVK